MKRFLLLVVLASHTYNIMPMFNVMPTFNVFVCCFSLGCTIPEENECINLDLCCAGIVLGCPGQTNAATPPEKNNNSHVTLPKNNGHAILHNGTDTLRKQDCTAVVCVQPDGPKNISLAQHAAVAQVKKTVDTKTHKMAVAHTSNMSKSKKFTYSYSYHSETILTSNSYSKRTVERVITPHENTERKSAVVRMTDPDQQFQLGVQRNNSASSGPIITEID